MYFALNISFKKRHEDFTHSQGQFMDIMCRIIWFVIVPKPLSIEMWKGLGSKIEKYNAIHLGSCASKSVNWK